MKNQTYIYCGEDGNAGKSLAGQIRDRDSDNKVRLLSCEFFGGPEPDAEHVIIMPDVPEHIGSVIRAAYPQNVVEAVPQSSGWPIAAAIAFQEGQRPLLDAPSPKRKPGRPRKAAA